MEQFLYNLMHGYGYLFKNLEDIKECLKYLVDNNMTWHTGAEVPFNSRTIEHVKCNIINSGGCYIYYDGKGIYLRRYGSVNEYSKDYANGIITYSKDEYKVELI